MHLVGGPNPGDTRAVLLMLIDAFETGGRFFGRQANAAPYIFMSTVPPHTLLEAASRLGCALDAKKISSTFNLINTDGETLIKRAAKFNDGTVLLVDQLMCFMGGDANNFHTVRRFLAVLEQFCAERHFTLVGSHPSAKIRQRDLIYSPRQRLYGSVAWGHGAYTVMWVQPKDLADVQCKHRIVYSTFPNGQGFESSFQYEHGKLVRPAPVGFKLCDFLDSDSDGSALHEFLVKHEHFRAQEFLRWGRRNHRLSKRTLERMLASHSDCFYLNHRKRRECETRFARAGRVLSRLMPRFFRRSVANGNPGGSNCNKRDKTNLTIEEKTS